MVKSSSSSQSQSQSQSLPQQHGNNVCGKKGREGSPGLGCREGVIHRVPLLQLRRARAFLEETALAPMSSTKEAASSSQKGTNATNKRNAARWAEERATLRDTIRARDAWIGGLVASAFAGDVTPPPPPPNADRPLDETDAWFADVAAQLAACVGAQHARAGRLAAEVTRLREEARVNAAAAAAEAASKRNDEATARNVTTMRDRSCLAALEKTQAKLVTKLRRIHAISAKLEDDKAALTEQVSSLRRRCEESERAASASEESMRMHEAENLQLARRAAALSERVSRLKESVARETMRADDADARALAAEAASSSLATRAAASARASSAASTGDSKLPCDGCSSLAQANALLSRELGEAKAKLDEPCAACAQLKQHVSRERAEARAAAVELQAAQEQVSRLSVELLAASAPQQPRECQSCARNEAERSAKEAEWAAKEAAWEEERWKLASDATTDATAGSPTSKVVATAAPTPWRAARGSAVAHAMELHRLKASGELERQKEALRHHAMAMSPMAVVKETTHRLDEGNGESAEQMSGGRKSEGAENEAPPGAPPINLYDLPDKLAIGATADGSSPDPFDFGTPTLDFNATAMSTPPEANWLTRFGDDEEGHLI